MFGKIPVDFFSRNLLLSSRNFPKNSDGNFPTQNPMSITSVNDESITTVPINGFLDFQAMKFNETKHIYTRLLAALEEQKNE